MFIRIFSDIHLENGGKFEISHLDTDKDTILLLPGDLMSIKRNRAHEWFLNQELFDRFKHTFAIPGNHEYYGGSIINIDDKMEEYYSKFTNVTYLQLKTRNIDGVNFIGATLWTDFNGGNPNDKWNAASYMNDYRVIRDGTKGDPYKKRLTTDRVEIIHKQHLKFIKECLYNFEGQKNVVMTHHAPSINSIHPYYRENSNVNTAYYSALDDLFYDYDIALWAHGHSHQAVVYENYKTIVVCNPVGYTGEYTSCNPVSLLEI
jgi:3',5'-cyclic AMP phosphodiesterase CpdA